MGKIVKITCDLCKEDITHTNNCEGYRIALTNQSIPSVGGFVTLMAAYPHLEHDMYFCGQSCLLKWAAKRIAANEEAERVYNNTPRWVLTNSGMVQRAPKDDSTLITFR